MTCGEAEGGLEKLDEADNPHEVRPLKSFKLMLHKGKVNLLLHTVYGNILLESRLSMLDWRT